MTDSGTARDSALGRERRRPSRAVAGLALACHPGPAVAVTALVTALAAIGGRGAAGLPVVTAAVLTGQLSVGWCNDAVDAPRDAATGRMDKPIVTGRVGAGTVRAAAFAALALCVPLSLACGVVAGLVHLAAVGAAWAYNLRLKSTLLSWLPYAVGFGAVPAFVATGLPGRPWPAWWAVLAGALLGCGAHLGNVLPDIAGDMATGVRGWPQRLGPRRVRILLPLPLLAASVLLVLAPPGPAGPVRWAALGVVCLCTAAGALLGGRSPRVPFAAAVAAAAVDVALLAATGTGVLTTS
ncbi:UbiA family prenyltransferase [Microbispora corallina]|uniref:Membrane protein n=1 Tax=Microbispora corallina TaxID=83302 RepID=A0ABQ4G4Z3_9ACTN|nr:UbiA family prenyltransferase [Microbispora corallina]GIH42152.1 membrane protein [Microbispora corallina]